MYVAKILRGLKNKVLCLVMELYIIFLLNFYLLMF